MTYHISYIVYCFNFKGVSKDVIDEIKLNIEKKNKLYISQIIENNINPQIENIVYILNKKNIKTYIIDYYNNINIIINYLLKSRDKENKNKIQKYIINNQINVFLELLNKYQFISSILI